MSKKLYLLLYLSFLQPAKLLAQVAAWGGGADYNDVSFGFHFQYITSDFKILKKQDWQAPYFDVSNQKYVTTGLTSISSSTSQGFAVGFIARLRINDNLEIRTTPALVFADRSITYQFYNPALDVTKTINASQVETPFTVKIKSDRIGNVRAYLIGGVKYSYGLSGAKKEDPNISPLDKLVANQRGYGSYETGIGFDIYFNYFKFSPELKVSNSFGNVLVNADNPYVKPLDRLFLHTVVFSIYFE